MPDFFGENSIGKMSHNIFKCTVLLFPALRDMAPFENQFLEMSFFPIFCIALNQCTLSATTFYIHFERSKIFLLTVLYAGC